MWEEEDEVIAQTLGELLAAAADGTTPRHKHKKVDTSSSLDECYVDGTVHDAPWHSLEIILPVVLLFLWC